MRWRRGMAEPYIRPGTTVEMRREPEELEDAEELEQYLEDGA